jgi:Fic-DOC domain mobile mystery protein B
VASEVADSVNDDRALDGELDDGQTPLDPDESNGLIPKWVATRGDLNAAEADNIRRSTIWGDRQLAAGVPVASEAFLRGLHAAMFKDVWDWAGIFRSTERNIGVAPHQIAPLLRNLFNDTDAWREFNTYDLDEQAARLHHKLTWIHPFPNGNGRVSRYLADYYLCQNGGARFSWGASLPSHESRRRYLAAIRAAYVHDFALLFAYVRT